MLFTELCRWPLSSFSKSFEEKMLQEAHDLVTQTSHNSGGDELEFET